MLVISHLLADVSFYDQKFQGSEDILALKYFIEPTSINVMKITQSLILVTKVTI